MTRPSSVVLVFLLIALGYWLWFSLTLRVIDNDDAVSILAAQSVLESGYQRLPSGYVYPRGFLPNYLTAGSIYLFGLNNFSIMLPSLLFGIGSLCLVYRIAKDIIKNSWLGVIAVALLISLSIQTWYATGPRMYMASQFFTLLATYSAWRGFIQDEMRFKIVAVLALVGATFSSLEIVILLVSLPITLIAYIIKIRGSSWRQLLCLSNIVSALLVGLAATLMVSLVLSTEFPTVVGHGGADPDRVGLNLSYVSWTRHLLHLERSIPYSIAFVLIAYFSAFKGLRNKAFLNPGLAYLILLFTFSFLVYGFVVKSGGHRLIFFILPVYALLAAYGVLIFSLAAKRFARAGFRESERRERYLLPSLLIIGLTLSVALASLKQIAYDNQQSSIEFITRSLQAGPSFGTLAKTAYGLPCIDFQCDTNRVMFYRELKLDLNPSDLVLSSSPLMTNYFLGKVDGWIFNRDDSRTYMALENGPVDEYLGIPIIDNVEELIELENGGHRVWVISVAADEGAFSADTLQTISAGHSLFNTIIVR